MEYDMKYEVLKKLESKDNQVFDNFIELKNNIITRSKNINGTFRLIEESLLKYLNKRHHFVNEKTNSIINDTLKDFNFNTYILQARYHVEIGRINYWLKEIQIDGNKTVHNTLKCFDEQDAEVKFIFIMEFVMQILNIELNNYEFNKEQEEIRAVFRKYLQLGEKQEITEEEEKVSVDDIKKAIQSIDDELKTKYEKANCNDKEFVDSTTIEQIRDLVSVIIEDIKKEKQLVNIEDFKIGEYANFYKIYCKLNQNTSGEQDEDFSLELKADAYEIRKVTSRRYHIRTLEWYTKPKAVNTVQDEDYNRQIVQKIEKTNRIQDSGYYYIQEQKPVLENDHVYYMLDIKKANDKESKNSHKIMYSKEKIFDSYAVKIDFAIDEISLLGKKQDIYIVCNSEIAIRPCEIKKIIYIITGKNIALDRKHKFYQELMNFLNANQCNILDVVTSNQKTYNDFISSVNNSKQGKIFEEAMDKARKIINENKDGHNVLRYLLGTLKNRILKAQYMEYNRVEKRKTVIEESNEKLSDLFLNDACNYFDKCPFSLSLLDHKTNYKEVSKYINPKLYYDDKIVGKIKELMGEKQTVYIEKSQIELEDKEIPSLIQSYNYYLEKNIGNVCEEKGFKINIEEDKYLYIEKDYRELMTIIKNLKAYSTCNKDSFYSNHITKVLEEKTGIDVKQKEILKKAFNNTQILLLYGEAGTGKTEVMCNYLTEVFKGKSKLYVANTHSAKRNLERRISSKYNKADKSKSRFATVKSITDWKETRYYDVVFFDECKSISNRAMKIITEKLDFTYGIFAGDINQISAVELGNWFQVAKRVVDENSISELSLNHRTQNEELLNIWNRVRKCDDTILQDMYQNKYIKVMSDEIYQKQDDDEIILCLNYGGRYGINSMNSYFQNSNPNVKHRFKTDVYKADDPIVFNENVNNKYNDILYNGMKGKIEEIDDSDEEYISFDLKIEEYYLEDDFIGSGLTYIASVKSAEEKWTIFNLKVKREKEDEDNEDDEQYVVPFDISYALSIHKAQGLQYNSVKIIITPESETIMNNEIFYTAITRAKQKLKIYVMDRKQIEELDIVTKEEKKEDPRIIKKKIARDEAKRVEIGSTIKIRKVLGGTQEVYKIIEAQVKKERVGYRSRYDSTIFEYKSLNNSNLEKGEILSTSGLAQELLGKYEGEKVILKDENLEKCEYIIEEIL